MSKIKLIRDNIVNISADALVVSANKRPKAVSGMEITVYRKAYVEFFDARNKIGYIEFGDANIVESPVDTWKYIIFVVVPKIKLNKKDESSNNPEHIKNLEECYEKCLKCALEKNCESIVFPVLGTGSLGYSRNISLEVSHKVFRKYESAIDIRLALFDKETMQAISESRAYPNPPYEVVSYISDEKVDEIIDKEYDGGDMEITRHIIQESYKKPQEKDFLQLINIYREVPDDYKQAKHYEECGLDTKLYHKVMKKASSASYRPALNTIIKFGFLYKISYANLMQIIEDYYGYSMGEKKKILKDCIDNGKGWMDYNIRAN